ncbi:uncharacterized protein LOC136093124 [Hydra vulgaris]|uniref:uncharacterized protein LOC136093124 n=1 Tax=Hydra vulgaris TaxID=6087 RepID=UPI0032E9C9C8
MLLEKKKTSVLKNNISNVLEVEKVDKTLDKTFPINMSVEGALALKMNTDLSNKQYQMIRNSALVHNVHIYPTLHDIFVEKLKRYPENIHFSEISAKCILQSMLDYTVSRITEMIDMPNFGQSDEIFGVLYGKIGFDEASSQSIYKQKYDTSNASIELKNEENLFSTAFVPLLLKVEDGEIWKNENPSSCQFCRPLHLQYKKESPILSREEESGLKNQINTLKTFCKVFNIAGTILTFNISYRIYLTMFDNKVVSALTETKSTQSCNVCNAKPKEMSYIDLLKAKTENDSALGLGISALHCWIKCLEFILHSSYKIEIKKYKPKTIEQKLSVDLKKKEIQVLFRERLSLYVDMPKTGSGNTNDGNTARRAFKNSEVFSEITKVDCDIIKRLHNILITISCGFPIIINELDLYCTETAKRIVNLYNWYVMPPTVHKLLLHSSSISNKLPLPIGIYSEDALESLNKQRLKSLK